MRQNDSKHKHTWFAFYDKFTDELVCCGDYNFCLEHLHLSKASFRTILMRARKGTHGRLTVYEYDLEADDNV